ncbi:MAG: protein kinase [Anaerolineales bacterium]
MALEQGSILNDRYRIDGQLGKGGMGAVYLAFDQTLGIKVAVKENLNLNPESERQFKREASLLAGLRHPNLPRVTDHFILEGRQYLVMDFIEGEDLHARAKRQLPSVAEVVGWASAVADALAHLHSRQPPIIHRDIKPANIKLQPDGTVVLVDFGLAKVADQKQTTTGARGLTPGYSPPEQYGSGRTDARSDQYALAATIYALLTGSAPTDSIERMMGNEQLRPPAALNPQIPAEVDEALRMALSISKDERFPDMTTFAAALRGEIAAKTVPANLPKAAQLREGRRWWLWALGGLATIGLILVIGGGIALALAGGLPTLPGLAEQATATPAAEPTIQSFAGDASPTPLPTRQPTAPPTAEPTATLAPTEVLSFMGGGGRLAFVSDRDDGRTLQIWTIDPEGTNPQQLTFGPGDKNEPRWSPDGSRLLFTSPGGRDQFGNDLGLDVWVINSDGTGIKNVTHHVGDDSGASWSPDGQSIAFTSTRVNDLAQVFVQATSCLNEEQDSCWDIDARNISAGYAVESDPAWSPEGGTIAVSASINGAPGRILLRSPFPGQPTRLDPTDHIVGAENLAWSPDASLIAFTWIQPTMNEIWLVRMSDRGAGPIKLTNSLGNKDPAFSADGQWVAFTSTRDQNPEIYLMTANGGNQTNLTQSPSSRDLQPDWQPAPEP